MKNYLLFFILIIIPTIVFNQSTSISGAVIGAEGQSIRLLAYDDFISKKLITLDKEKIGADGKFDLSFDIEETRMAFLDVNYQRTEIFVEAGKSYDLNVNYDGENQLGSYFDRKGLLIELNGTDPNELNQLIWKFNSMYNKFVMENFDHIYKVRDISRITAFRNEVKAAFPDVESGYFMDYVSYKLADVEQYARLKGKVLLANDYFTEKKVLYENVEYTFFFNEYFDKFLITSPSIITISDLIIAVNDNADHCAIDDALAKQSYLEDDNFRELVLLHGLRGLYYNGTYKKPQLLKMIANIGETTEDPMHRKIANNLLETLPFLSPGSPAPDIQLTGIAGQKFRLKSIKGKVILLTFFRSGQEGTANSFDRLTELFNLYSAGLEIISVSMDNAPMDYLTIANSGNYYWTFAHYANNPEIYDLYNIKDLPLYVLIDVEGNIAAYPAPPPGDKLERLVMKVIH